MHCNTKFFDSQAEKTIGSRINQFFTPLTSEDREKVLIVDNSPYERDRSKKVELLSWIFDHNRRIMKRGFRLLTLGWSDGTSFLPVDFALLASAKTDKQLQ